MTTTSNKTQDVKTRFRRLFELQTDQLNGQRNDVLHRLQQRALQQAERLPFPSRRDEDWKYTSVSRLLNLEFQLAPQTTLGPADLEANALLELDAYRLVFVNGYWQEGLSDLSGLPEGVAVSFVREALENNEPAIIDQLETIAQEAQFAFPALNVAFARAGVHIHAMRNVRLDKPIVVLNLTAGSGTPFVQYPQLVVIAETGAQLEIIEDNRSLPGDSNHFTNVLRSFDLKANARVEHSALQSEGASAYRVSNTFVFQDRDSHYINHQLDLGGQLVRNNMGALHRGENITTDYNGIYFGTDRQHIDNQTFIDHAVPHCQSNELYKGILTDRARGVFNGKVLVRQDAQKTNAFQQNSSLVLSDTAAMDTKPQLEIYADDVRCSHGATIGQLDEASVFYLRSRGVPDGRARQMLQFAFLTEVLEKMTNDTLREEAERRIEAKFGTL